MSIKEKYYVERISYDDTKEWILKKHYAHRIPSISYAFGLFDNDKILQGDNKNYDASYELEIQGKLF